MACVVSAVPVLGCALFNENNDMLMAAGVSIIGEKKTVLFGSYGWGTGEWMDSWREDAGASGVHVVETAIANNEPDDEALETCRKAGEALI